MTNERRPVGSFDAQAALAAELAAVRAAFDDDDATIAVHQGRVRLKRIRAIARLLAASQREAGQALNAAGRAAMTGLSEARDLAALEACARENDLPALADALSARRAALGPPPIAAARRTLAAVELAMASLAPATPEAIADGVLRLARRARRSFTAARGAREPEARHTWRKREKDRLHALDVLGPHWPAGVRRRRRTGKRLARALGAERDVLLLLERLAADPALAAAAEPDAVERLRRRFDFLADRADRLGRAAHRHGA